MLQMRSRGLVPRWLGVLTLSLAGAVIGVPPDGVLASEPIKTVALTVDVFGRDIIHDPVRNVIYATADMADERYPGQLVTIDPTTGEVIAHVSVGPLPDALAITEDASALYVGINELGAVRKVMLPTMTLGWSATFPTYLGQPMTANEIEVMPGTTDTIAVSTRTENTSYTGVVIIDSGVPRAKVAPSFIRSDSIAFASPTTLYGSDASSGQRVFVRHAVDADGITTIDATPNLGSTIVYHDGLVFTQIGHVIDPSATPPAVVDELPESQGRVGIDHQRDIAYFVSAYVPSAYDPNAFQNVVRAFDTATRSPLGQWRFPQTVDTPFRRTLVVDDGVLATVGGPAQGNVLLIDLNVSLLPPGDAQSLGEFTSLTPERVLDTRTGVGIGGTSRRLGPGETIDVAVTGRAGVPLSGVDSVVMNVTVADPTHPGFLTVFPTGIERPTTSSLNFESGVTVANLVTMPVGAGGHVSVYNPYGDVDVLFDVAGFYAGRSGPDGARFHALAPVRLMDTRDGVGGRVGSIGSGESATLQVAGRGGVPAIGARSVVLNVTVTQPSAPSYIAVAPTDVPLPAVSNLNFTAGTTIANQVIVRLPTDGTVAVYNHAGEAHVVADVVGYFDDVEVGNSGRFVSFRPFRALDTREDSPFAAPGDLWPGDILYWGQQDEDLSAHVLNVTVTGTQGVGYLSVYPYNTSSPTPPNASTLNYSPGRTVPNHAISATGPYTGFYNAGGYVHLIVDVVGGFI